MATRIQTTKNGDKIFCAAITRENRQTSWRRDDLDEEVEQGLNTGPEQEMVAGYEELSVAGYEELVDKRSVPVMAEQEKVWMEDQMEPRWQQLLLRMVVLEEEYKGTRTELAAEREKNLRLNWTNSSRLVFGYDRG